MKKITLNNSITIPQLGFGVFRNPEGDSTYNSVREALEAGYRHIDTAMIYGNEASVGRAIKDSSVPREEIFITTKLWNDDIREGKFVEAFNESMKKLQLDYLDQWLIHWPVNGFEKAWVEMEKLYKSGKIKAIGVSNFNIHHLESLSKIQTVKPCMNQIESHPYFSNSEVIKYCFDNNIAVTVWSPLGGGKTNALKDEVIVGIAEKHSKSPAQVIIRWHLQRNVIVIPKSAHKERIIQNFDVFDFELSTEEMKAINALDKNARVGSDPETFDF